MYKSKQERSYYTGKVWGPRGGYWVAEQYVDDLSCEMLALPPIRHIEARNKREAIQKAKARS